MIGGSNPWQRPMAEVHGIAVRPGDGEDMVETLEQRAVTGAGLVGDPRAKGRRGLTLLSREKWLDVTRELKVDLPWYARRANVLVYGLDLKQTIGRLIRVGDIIVKIWGETKPCGLMDEIHPGLRDALSLDLRGGVHGEIMYPGVVRLGDPVTIMEVPLGGAQPAPETPTP